MKSNNLNNDDLNKIGLQLSCPEGEFGVEIGKSMALNNASMTFDAYSKIDYKKYKNIVEIGFGNGSHFSKILSNDDIHITGLELSETMLNEATIINKTLLDSKKLTLELTNANKLDIQDSSIDLIITVNTIYFWENLTEYLKEIYSKLITGGQIILCFADKDFMKTLPFTVNNFKLYSVDQ